ncbi:MAG: hypothetical protein P4L75_00730 [Clostridia bacterium]|nr:hypothetical protein [Clostridia bacterium]
MAVTQGELKNILLDYAKSASHDRWGDLEGRLAPVQESPVRATRTGTTRTGTPRARTPRFYRRLSTTACAALVVAAAVALSVFGKPIFTSLRLFGAAQEGSATAAAQSSIVVSPGGSSVISAEKADSALYSVASASVAADGPASSAVSGNPAATPVFCGYDHRIYQLSDSTLSARDVGLELAAATVTAPYRMVIYRIAGVDPSVGIAVEVDGRYLRAGCLMNDTFLFKGAAYRIADANQSSGERGAFLGAAGTHRLYAVKGVDPSKRIQINLAGGVFADAVRQ